MANLTQTIVRDANGNPVPQNLDSITNQFNPTKGTSGASWVLLYDSNGHPLLTASNPGYVSVTNGTTTLAVNSDGSLNATLAGSNVTAVKVASYTTVASDTTLHNIPFNLPSGAQKTPTGRSFIMYNKTDQSLTTGAIYLGLSAIGVGAANDFGPALAELGKNGLPSTIGTASYVFVTDGESYTVSSPADQGLFQIQFTTAPTEGTTVELWLGY